jgi:hypothetical protein
MTVCNLISTFSFFASFMTSGLGLVLNAIIIAFDAAASKTSDSVTEPALALIILILTSPVLSSVSAVCRTSAEPFDFALAYFIE